MNRKIAIGALVGALLMSSSLIGVSYGGSNASITEPTVIELNWDTEGKDSRVRYYLLGEYEGITGQITMKKLPLFDQDGNRVGMQHISCTAAGPNWVCTLVSKIADGPYTDKGTVVGIAAKPLNIANVDEGVNVVITGGTGAYENVGGHAVEVGGTGETTYTLFLLPS